MTATMHFNGCSTERMYSGSSAKSKLSGESDTQEHGTIPGDKRVDPIHRGAC